MDPWDDVAAEPFAFDGMPAAEDQDFVAAEPFADESHDSEPVGEFENAQVVTLDFRDTNDPALKIRALTQKVERQMVTIERLKRQLVAARTSDLPQAPCDKSGCASTGILMALARNRGHGSSASAVTFGQLLNAGKGKSFTNETTLNRWELALGTTIMASAATFHETNEDLFRQAASCPTWSCAGQVILSDATRSKAWGEDKLQPTRVTTYFCFDVGDCASRTTWPDVKRVVKGTATATLRFIHRQLRVIQCCAFDPEAATSGLGRKQLRFIWIFGDCGGDMAAMRPMVAGMYALSWNVWVFGWPCFSHQSSLANCRLLVCFDRLAVSWHASFMFYNSVVKIAKLLRSRCNDIYESAVRKCDGNTSHPFAIWAKRKCPACDTGRWGSVSTVLKHLLGLSVEGVLAEVDLFEFIQMVLELLVDVFCDEAENQPQPIQGPVDEDRIDQNAAHIEKRGRWFRESFKALSDNEFILMMEICFDSIQGLAHLLNFLQKNHEGAESHLQLLVYGKGREILSEMEEMQFDVGRWDRRCAKAKAIFPDQYFAAVVSAHLMQAAEYDARIMTLLRTFPAHMLWFVRTRPDRYCHHRQQTAALILNMPFDRLDSSTAKAKAHLQDELEEMRDTGLMDEHLHMCISRLAKEAIITVQLIESANKTVCHITGLAKNIHEPLVSSRLTSHRELNEAEAASGCALGKGCKGSTKKVLLQKFQECLQNYKTPQYTAISFDLNRWRDVPALPGTSCLSPLSYAKPTTAAAAAPLPAAAAAAAAAPPGGDDGGDGADFGAEPADVEADAGPAVAVPLADAPAAAAGAAAGSPRAEAGGAAAAAPGNGKPPDQPWAAASDWFVSTTIPENITSSVLTSTSRYALDWSRAFPLAPILKCFWPSREVALPDIGQEVWVLPTKFRNIGHLARLVVYFEGDDFAEDGLRVMIRKPYHFKKSNVTIAEWWLALQHTADVSTNIVQCQIEWISSVAGILRGHPTVACALPRDAWVPPRRKGGERKRRRPAGKRASRPKKRPRSKPAARQSGDVGPGGGGGDDDAPGAADKPDDSDESDDGGELDTDDEAEELAAAGMQELWCDDIGEPDEIVDAIWESLGKPGEGGEGPREGDHGLDPDELFEWERSIEIIEPPLPPPFDPPDWTPGLCEGKVLADLQASWSAALLKSVHSLKHRSDAFKAALSWHITATDRSYGKSIGCTAPIVASSKRAMSMVLLEDPATGVVSPWHWVEGGKAYDPPVVFDAVTLEL